MGQNMTKKPRHSTARRPPLPFVYKIPTFVWITLLLLALPADAQEKEKKLSDIVTETALPEGAVRHAPEGCEFEITFPGEP